jgi:ABC-2 type transport system permease protein
MSTSELDALRPGESGEPGESGGSGDTRPVPATDSARAEAHPAGVEDRAASYRVAARSGRGSLRMLRSELRLVFRRRRNIALLAVLSCAPILLGIAVRVSAPGDGDGPAFLGQITENGLFLAFTSLVVTLPLFLPVAVSVVSGESVAGEASTGTLRNLLVVPLGRTRLLLVKYAGIAAYALVAALTVFVVGTIVGLILFAHGPVTLISGDVVPFSTALWRALLVTGYVGAMLLGIAAIGLFISTLTEVPMGAMAATAVLVIAAEIADSVPQIGWLHPYLFTHYWLAFGDLLRNPIYTHEIGLGLLSQAAYIVIFGSLAWARFTGKDVTS